MTKTRRLPFQNLGAEAWQNLAMAALFVVYLTQIIWSLTTEGPLASSVGLDFRAYWSGGSIANTASYADVYDPAMLTNVQKQIVPLTNYQNAFEVAPVSILPIFIPIFQGFALLPPVPSFYLWSILNLIGFFLYLRFFFRKLGISNWQRLTIMGLLAYSSFQNFFWGQIDLLLLICVGEFIRYLHDAREFRAGLWLGGLILKPQLLILVGPVLLLQRKWRLLGGFCATIFVALGGSLLLGTWSSFIGLFNTMTKFASGIPTNAPENMMNWRMIGERLASFLSPTISWGVAGAGLAGTVILTFLLWRKPIPTSSPDFLVAFTGTLAATLAVTWHSHIHMAMVMLPPVLFLYAKNVFPHKLFNWWMFIMPFIIIFLALPVKLLGLDRYNALPGLTGLCMLIFNLIFLTWAWKSRNNRPAQEVPAQLSSL